jgi:hypothetical protein
MKEKAYKDTFKKYQASPLHHRITKNYKFVLKLEKIRP